MRVGATGEYATVGELSPRACCDEFKCLLTWRPDGFSSSNIIGPFITEHHQNSSSSREHQERVPG